MGYSQSSQMIRIVCGVGRACTIRPHTPYELDRRALGRLTLEPKTKETSKLSSSMAKNKISDPGIYTEVWVQGIKKLKRIEMSIIYHHFPSDQNLCEPIFESQTKIRFIKGMFWTPSFLVYIIYGLFLISGLHAIQNRNFSPSINGGHFQGTECFLSTVT